MVLNYFDIALLFLLVIFLLRGVMNGVLAELFALLALFGGLWYAHYAYTDIAAHLAAVINQPFRRDLAAYGLVFVSVLVAVTLLGRIASKAFSLTAPSLLDKGLGALLGLARGMGVCSLVLVLLPHFLPDARFFNNSLVTPWMEPFLHFAKQHLPAGLG